MNAPAPLTRGVYAGLPMERYVADPCIVPSLSGSIVDELLNRSPRHAWFSHPRLNPKHRPWHREDFDVGTCAHSLLLEGNEDQLAVIDPQDYPSDKTGNVPGGWTNKAIKFARDNARAAGKTPILLESANAVREMVGIAREFIAGSEIAGIFEDGASEQTMIWDEGPSWFRCRPDFLSNDGILLHYKTTARAAEPNSFGRMMMVQMGYDTAAMFYERGYDALHEDRRTGTRSVFLVQETEAPYCCSLLGLDPEMMDLASRKVERAIQLWAHCMKTGKWPAYPARICYISPKPWQVSDFEEREFTRPGGDVDPLQQEHGLQI